MLFCATVCITASQPFAAETNNLRDSTSVLHVICDEGNDVWRALLSAPLPPAASALARHDTLADALSASVPGDALMALANGAAGSGGGSWPASDWAALEAANLRGAYVEMPEALPGPGTAACPAPTPAWYFDRLVSLGDTLGPAAPYLSLLTAQGANFCAYDTSHLDSAVLAYAHVAGSTHAVFGLPPNATLNPVLFQLDAPAPNVLIGAVALSCLVQCRYTPVDAWAAVWDFILSKILAAPYSGFPKWQPLVAASGPPPASASEAVKSSGNALQVAVTSAVRATDWLLTGSGLLVRDDNATCPAPFAPREAALTCMLEGFSSKMAANGSQNIANDVRMDCSAEAAMALAMRAAVEAERAVDVPAVEVTSTASAFATASLSLLNFTWLYSNAAQAHDNASDASFGILEWGVSGPTWRVCSYGDDNARVLVATLVAAAALRRAAAPAAPGVETMALKSVLGNLRLASSHGFRPGRINYADLAGAGWRAYHYSGDAYANSSSPQPHYQAQMWAVFLLAHALTGWAPLREAALAGLEATMAVYTLTPTRFVWTEYLSEEQARLLLPLAWLVRTDAAPNATHLGWLTRVAGDLLATQHASGGILETLGTEGLCDACPPSSNDAYGSGEAPLIAATGDPFTDQLYGNNFALVALVEALHATGDVAMFGAPTARLAAYLAATQVASAAFPELDGAWMRGFNVDSWEFGGSASDIGWGPWSVETGWSVTWTSAALFSVAANSSLFDLVVNTPGGGVTPASVATLCPIFFAGTDVACPAAT